MAKPRFAFTFGSVSVFADRIRLKHDDRFGRFYLTVAAVLGDPGQAPIDFDLPLKDRKAYLRAAEAFNAILDEHDEAEECRRERRRQRSSGHAQANDIKDARP